MRTPEVIWGEVSFYEPVFNDEHFEWAINYGVKVMKMKETGKLQFANTRIGGDFYAPLTPEQKNRIYQFGFAVGARMVAIETLKKQVDRANRLIRNNQHKEATVSKLNAYRSEMLNVIHDYTDAVKSIVKGASESDKFFAEQTLEKILA